ncbi:MAG: hypothetical protein HZB16_08400 [Armatimonadetes bacterium]|nr:hypothetical protein [Armatimonadota bacterium]
MKQLLCCCLLAVAGCQAQPRVEGSATALTLANAHLTATIDLARGGWLGRLAGADGRVYAGGGMVYTDWGLFTPRGVVSSAGDAAPKVTQGQDGGQTWVRVEGTFHADAACEPAASSVGYALRYSLGDKPELAVEVAVTPTVALKGTPAFLAAQTQMTGLSEWLAWTVEGRINERITRDGRCFESARTPLDPARPELELLYADGRRLVIAGIGAEGCPLQNVFLHVGTGGSGALFVGLLDGESPGWPAGQTWRARYALRLAAP